MIFTEGSMILISREVCSYESTLILPFKAKPIAQLLEVLQVLSGGKARKFGTL